VRNVLVPGINGDRYCSFSPWSKREAESFSREKEYIPKVVDRVGKLRKRSVILGGKTVRDDQDEDDHECHGMAKATITSSATNTAPNSTF
jgi:hypothetical protein